jgi:hypothetical protein
LVVVQSLVGAGVGWHEFVAVQSAVVPVGWQEFVLVQSVDALEAAWSAVGAAAAPSEPVDEWSPVATTVAAAW